MNDSNQPPTHDRRTFLVGSVAVLAAACTGSGEDQTAGSAPDAASGSSTTAASTTPEGGTTGGADPATSSTLEALTAATFASVPICVVAPAQTAGPFPTLEQLERRDITEGYPGHPLRLGLRVVDQGCAPVPGARVEIWHADASGDYSAYEDDGSGKDEGEGTNFLRGFQVADDEGIVEFQTIYPGWYEGRAVHIHVTASVDGQEVQTTQLYLDEAYTESVYADGEYAQFGPPDTGWADDGIIGDPSTDGSGIALVAAPTSLGEGTLGLINLGVNV